MIDTLSRIANITKTIFRHLRKAFILTRRWVKKHRFLAFLAVAGLLILRFRWDSWVLAATPFVIVASVLFGLWALTYLRKVKDAEAPLPSAVDLVRAWWFETNRLDMAKRKWDSACVGYGLAKQPSGMVKGLKETPVPPSMIDAKVAVEGDPVRATIKPGSVMVPVDKVIKSAPLLAEHIGCREVVVTRSRINGQAEVALFWKDPLGHSFPVKKLPLPSRDSDVAFGRRLDGSAATLSWEAGPVMVVGASGSGKSNVIWNILGDLVDRRIPIEVMCADPKGGMEMRAMKRNLGRQMGPVKVSFFAANPPATVTMVNHALAELRRRQPLIDGRKITEPTPEFPLLVVLIDEWVTVLPMLLAGGPKTQQAPIIQLLNESRSAGILPIAASQILHASTVGDIRNMFTQRILLRVNAAPAVDTVISHGLERGAFAHQLDKMQDRGMGWSDDDHGNLERFRAALVTDADIERILDGRSPKGMTRESRAGIKAPVKDTYVYRARSFGEFDRLEYIGISNSPRLRFEQHAAKDWAYCSEHGQWENWWLAHVDPAKMLIEGPFPRTEAEAREKAAIIDEMPVWNQVHNWNNPIAQAVTKRFPTRSRRIPAPASPDPEAMSEPTNVDLDREAAAMIDAEKRRRVPVPPMAALTVLYVCALLSVAVGVGVVT